jgi:hypothetical protein
MHQPNFPLKPISETYGVSCSSASVISLPGIPPDALVAMVQVESHQVRARFNATSSSTYVVTQGTGGGLALFVNTINTPWYEFLSWDMLNRMRLIGDGGDGILNVIYLGVSQP